MEVCLFEYLSQEVCINESEFSPGAVAGMHLHLQVLGNVPSANQATCKDDADPSYFESRRVSVLKYNYCCTSDMKR